MIAIWNFFSQVFFFFFLDYTQNTENNNNNNKVYVYFKLGFALVIYT